MLLTAICGIAMLLQSTAAAQQEVRRLPPASLDLFQNPPLRYSGPQPALASEFAAEQATLETAQLPRHDFAVYPSEHGPEIFETAPLGYGPSLSEHKDGFFQRLSVGAAWLDRGNFDDYGIGEIDTFARFALPLPKREWPLVITPTYNFRSISGPQNRDFPEKLHEAFVDFTWLPKLSPRWTAIVGIAPSVYSDFEADQSEAFRLTGQGLAKYEWAPGRWELIFGVLYLNRENVTWLPAGGLIWTPNPDIRYEMLFPTPKLAHRIDWGPGYEDWLYLAGQFGGNSYAIERAGGVPDILTLRDFRVLLGLERKKDGGAGHRLEVGYVFGRRAEFTSGIPDIEPDSTALIRMVIVY